MKRGRPTTIYRPTKGQRLFGALILFHPLQLSTHRTEKAMGLDVGKVSRLGVGGV